MIIGDTVELVPTDPAHVDRLIEIRQEPEVRRRWHAVEDQWPFDDESTAPYTIINAGSIVGYIQFLEELDPHYRSASIDIFLSAAAHGRGLGRDAVSAMARYLFAERGHHRITIDPVVDNAAAIACYEAVGFRRCGVMRRYELADDGWHDGLLMDLLREDLSQTGSP